MCVFPLLLQLALADTYLGSLSFIALKLTGAPAMSALGQSRRFCDVCLDVRYPQ
jgi:hypothetical protein